MAADKLAVEFENQIYKIGNGIQKTTISGIIKVGNLNRTISSLATATTSNPITIMRIGDSTVSGAGSGNGSKWGSAAQRNASAQFSYLTSGIVNNKSFIGDAWMATSPGYGVYNNNVKVTDGVWTASTAGLGGNIFKVVGIGASASGDFRMLLSQNAKKVRIYWLAQGNSITIQTNIGVIGSIPIGINTGKIEYYDIAVQNGAAYIELVNSTATIYVLGMSEIDDTQKILLLNAGANGATVATFSATTNQWDSLSTLKKLAPVLTIINLTINDANASTDIYTYQSKLVAIIEGALISGDVVLEIGAVSNTLQSTNGSLYGIRKAVFELAETYNLTVMSDPSVLGGGWMNADFYSLMADSWHPNYSGYTRIANNALLPLYNIIKHNSGI